MADNSIFFILTSLVLVYGVHCEFTINTSTDGTYSVGVDGKVWMPSGDTYFYADGTKYSRLAGNLRLIQTSTTSGVDKLGQWQDSEYLYHAGENVVTASIKTYNMLNIAIFSQKYVNDTYRTSSGDTDSVASAFPAFHITGERGTLGYLNFGGSFFGGQGHIVGQWSNTTTLLTSGITGGPIIMFDHQDNVLILAPFSQFMSSSIFVEDNTVSWGVMGGVDTIPAMYESATIVFYGNMGINQAMTDWGCVMRKWNNRNQTITETALTNNYLGFWTDNGAYYYHQSEKNQTYEATILDIKAYADKVGIPYRYVQYDDWWYQLGPRGGVLRWEAMPGIFPSGMQDLYKKTGWPVSAQNRWWSPDTTYAKQNGGKYNFIVEETKAIPQDKNFWVDLLKEAKTWGLTVYEQDWLDMEFAELNATLTTVNVARDWLMQMGEGASINGMTIQYCLANPRHALQLLEISTVIQARVSMDYHFSTKNWNIGLPAIFADAVGVRPSKDNFWTTSVQPGNRYSVYEPHPALQSVIATLSMGPVGPGDKIGYSNVSLIMRSCNADGLLLQPSRPARTIDTCIKQKAFGDGSGPDGEVWSTWSDISGFRFGTILAPIQSSAVKVTPSDAGFGRNFSESVIFKHTWPSTGSYTYFNETHPLIINDCVESDPCLWHSAPIIPLPITSVFVYGELQKWVPMSPKRVSKISISEDDIYVTVVGGVSEDVLFSFGRLDSTVINTIECNLGPSGSAVIQFMAVLCKPL